MHFALPPRPSSHPPPYARASIRSSAHRRRQLLQYLGYTVLFALSFYLLYSWRCMLTPTEQDGKILEDSTILIVTVLDESTMSEDYMTMVRVNREDYASRHGYKTFFTNTSTYKKLFEPAPSTWAVIPAIRNALTLHPDTDYVWSLSPHALITNMTLDLYSHILGPLPDLMLKDLPVVPPDSVIHTFSHLRPSAANLIMTQDFDNLAHGSFLLRNTLNNRQPSYMSKDSWTQFFLDAWFDPLYRGYAFQRAEHHALEHIVQWHPTIVAQLAIVPLRRFNSYNFAYPRVQVDAETGEERTPPDSMWQQEDLLVNFMGCTESAQRDCETEMRGYFHGWRKTIENIDGKPVEVPLMLQDSEYTLKAKSQQDGSTEVQLKRTHT